jgi:plastocyanin
MRMFNAGSSALLAVSLMAAACGGGSSSPTTPGGGTTPPSVTNTITITAQGASPRFIEIAVGSRVRMINNDTRAHNMASDPHPAHTDCPELNQIGLLAPGQSLESGNMTTARTCGFHDHDNPAVANLTGTITIR